MIVFRDDLPAGFRLCACGLPTTRAGLCGICAAVADLDDDEGLLRDDD